MLQPKLVRLLQLAYSAEKAAAFAYQGHAASLKNEDHKKQVRQIELDEWEQALRERQAELAELRTKLEDLEGAVDLRMSELIRDESARDEKELQGWKDLAKLYTGGDAAVNAKMLTEESPKDAAKMSRKRWYQVRGCAKNRCKDSLPCRLTLLAASASVT